MKILVTGGAGFIGSNLVSHIERLNPEVDIAVLDDLSTGYAANLEGTSATFYEGTIVDPEAVLEAADGADAIVHLAALGSVPRSVKDPVTSHMVNLTGTLNVMEAARANGSHVLFSSSSSVYGANPKLPKSEFDWTRPMSPYAVTKLGAEGYVLAYQYAYGLPTLAFRFFNVYGPRQAADHAYAAVIPKFTNALLTGGTLVVDGDGEQSRDFTSVDTVCQVIYDAIQRKVTAPDPINLAYGSSTSLLELIAMLEDFTGKTADVQFGPPRVGDVRASQSNGERIREFFPNIVPMGLEEGLLKTVDWFRSDVL